MHSVILDHYTQSPFNNTCHQRHSPQRHHSSSPRIKSQSGTQIEDPVPATVMSMPAQSLLTWSPSQVMMTSPLVNWTPYLATMATNPTAKYSLDLQLSCKRTDSGFEDITTTTSSEDEMAKASNQFPDIDMPAAEIKDILIPSKSTTASPRQGSEIGPPALRSRRSSPVSSAELGQSSTRSVLARKQSSRVKPAPLISSKPSSARTSRPTSSSDHELHFRSNSSKCETVRASKCSPGDKSSPRRIPSRSTDTAITHKSGPSSSRRSSNVSMQRTTSRTESFILGRNEPRPVNFESVVRRTRQKQQASNNTTIAFPILDPNSREEEKDNDDEAQSDSANHHHSPPPDYPIDWTAATSRAAQYAEIDGKNRGATGLWRRFKHKLKLGKRRSGAFYDGGSDAGSVRRYRLDIDTDDLDKERETA